MTFGGVVGRAVEKTSGRTVGRGVTFGPANRAPSIPF
jgi:hypothetical protein